MYPERYTVRGKDAICDRNNGFEFIAGLLTYDTEDLLRTLINSSTDPKQDKSAKDLARMSITITQNSKSYNFSDYLDDNNVDRAKREEVAAAFGKFLDQFQNPAIGKDARLLLENKMNQDGFAFLGADDFRRELLQQNIVAFFRGGATLSFAVQSDGSLQAEVATRVNLVKGSGQNNSELAIGEGDPYASENDIATIKTTFTIPAQAEEHTLVLKDPEVTVTVSDPTLRAILQSPAGYKHPVVDPVLTATANAVSSYEKMKKMSVEDVKNERGVKEALRQKLSNPEKTEQKIKLMQKVYQDIAALPQKHTYATELDYFQNVIKVIDAAKRENVAIQKGKDIGDVTDKDVEKSTKNDVARMLDQLRREVQSQQVARAFNQANRPFDQGSSHVNGGQAEVGAARPSLSPSASP